MAATLTITIDGVDWMRVMTLLDEIHRDLKNNRLDRYPHDGKLHIQQGNDGDVTTLRIADDGQGRRQ